MKAILLLLVAACAALAAPAAPAETRANSPGNAPGNAREAGMGAVEDAAPQRRYYLGVGAGFEGSNGIRFGAALGNHGVEGGGGLTYSGADGHMNYSYGARYLYTLYEGAYAWTGAGKTGHIRDGERAALISGALGLGVSIPVGTLFRLKLDSGWRVFSDSEEGDGMLQVGPTFNGAFVYEW